MLLVWTGLCQVTNYERDGKAILSFHRIWLKFEKLKMWIQSPGWKSWDLGSQSDIGHVFVCGRCVLQSNQMWSDVFWNPSVLSDGFSLTVLCNFLQPWLSDQHNSLLIYRNSFTKKEKSMHLIYFNQGWILDILIFPMSTLLRLMCFTKLEKTHRHTMVPAQIGNIFLAKKQCD